MSEKPKIGEWWQHEVYGLVYIFQDDSEDVLWRKEFECSIQCLKSNDPEVYRAFAYRRFIRKVHNAAI